jgi:hypothetical protein
LGATTNHCVALIFAINQLHVLSKDNKNLSQNVHKEHFPHAFEM